MVDPDIRVGDVVHDLIERGRLRVVEKAADSVAEYREREGFCLKSYKAHPLLDVTDDETVWRCVYISSDPSVSYGQSYAFPASRLARAPVEEASEDLERPYHSIQRALLAGLFANAAGNRDVETIETLALDACVPAAVVYEARELAEAATITADEPGSDA